MKVTNLIRFLNFLMVLIQIHSEEISNKGNLTEIITSQSELSYNQTLDDIKMNININTRPENNKSEENNHKITHTYSVENDTKSMILEDEIESLTDLYGNRTEGQEEDDFNLTEFMNSMEEKDEEEIESESLLQDVEKVDIKVNEEKSLSEFEKQISDFDAAEILTFEIPAQENEVSY
jgi:hypothetical protein